MSPLEQQSLQKILARLQKDFYHHEHPRAFFHDQSVLCQAITWPAAWLHEKGLHLPPQRYERLIENRLDDIAKHGDPQTCRAYFPRYLMHCLQQWFLHNGDPLCDELRHIRNQLWQVDAIVRAIQKSQPPDHAYTHNMALTHQILNGQQRRKKILDNTRQLTLL